MALREAMDLRHDHIGTEHVLLGIVRYGEGGAADAQMAAGIDLDKARRTVSASIDPKRTDDSPG